MFSKKISVLVVCFLPIFCFAEGVNVLSGTSKGQGFYYEFNEICYVITPKHVLDDGQISLITSSRDRYFATIEKIFKVDLALLKTNIPLHHCEGERFSQNRPLRSLLNIYEEGILKTKLEDGSTAQLKVDITGVDSSEYLQIRPSNQLVKLKQGYSGSVLYVANQPSGIILEVDKGYGYIYRSDALLKLIYAYFNVGTKSLKASAGGESTLSSAITPDKAQAFEMQAQSVKVGGSIRATLAPESNVDYDINLTENSPIRMDKILGLDSATYELKILDEDEIQVFKSRISGRSKDSLVFTPQYTGRYILRFIGKSDHAEFGWTISPYAQDSKLRGEGNVLDVGGNFESVIARDAVVSYSIRLNENSPIEFSKDPVSKGVSYKFEILDDRENLVFGKNISTRSAKRLSFTPGKDGIYRIRFTGKKGHGRFGWKVKSLALNSDLNGVNNEVVLGGRLKTMIAEEAKATFSISLKENSPVEFIKVPERASPSYEFLIYSKGGDRLLRQKVSQRSKKRFVFTPQKTGDYRIVLNGKKGYGNVEWKLKPFANDSDFRGKANVVSVGGQFKSKVADGAEITYKMYVDSGKSLEFIRQKQRGNASYSFYIEGVNGGAQLMGKFGVRGKQRFLFEPKNSGDYVLKIVGEKGFGTISWKVLEVNE